MDSVKTEDQWVVIQQKTFLNWANDQLIHGNRSLDNLSSDLCDGVKLVALVEVLQLRKIGRVYSQPTSRIQMLHNVSLALEAIADDNIKLVNIGTDDIVGGNLKLTLGLLWHLIIRYQISSSKAKAPPKKLMLAWFQNALDPLSISNLTSDWRDGIALHALLEFCKPGLSPQWRQLSPRDSLQNCRLAMQLAKEHLGVPKMISAEDFCSPDLDELSAMTYLSYFIRKNSPGYYGMLNWACRQLKTANISNLTTDWNDGYYLCALVHSFGGEVKGWPKIDRRNHRDTCQLGLDSARSLGVEPMFTAAELADPGIDHLTLMVYLSKFNGLARQKSNTERLAMDSHLLGLAVEQKPHPFNSDEEVTDQTLNTRQDFDNVRIDRDTSKSHGDQSRTLQVKATSPAADLTLLDAVSTTDRPRATFLPAYVGSPKDIEVWEPVQVHVSGEGITRATKGMEAFFTVYKNGLSAEITAEVEVSGQTVPCSRELKSQDECEFCYVPTQAGTYKVHVHLHGQPVAGSPFSAHVIDRSQVTILDDLQPLKDECDRLALKYGQNTELNFDVTSAGAGVFKAEVLSPGGKLPVEIRQSADRVTASFVAQHEGDHYIHVYWSQAPVDFSPLHAYCPGPQLSVDASKVTIEGSGAAAARATVPAEFLINGMAAGPGVPRVKVQGIYAELPVEVRAMKYNRYLCRYTSSVPGSFLLYVYWSDQLLPGCPLKIAVTSKGDVSKVKVSGQGLNGGVSNTELKICVDTREAGPGEVAAECHSHRHSARCDIKEEAEGCYTLRILPTESEKHVLHITYDGQHVPGSPFTLRIGEPPDASKVQVFGPGIRDGLVDTFESRFLVDTQGAGAGQLAVKIRGPKGGFRVDMSRETKAERTIVCRYDPSECGQYIISVRWSGVDVPGSPFLVHVVDSHRELVQLNSERPSMDSSEEWRADI